MFEKAATPRMALAAGKPQPISIPIGPPTHSWGELQLAVLVCEAFAQLWVHQFMNVECMAPRE